MMMNTANKIKIQQIATATIALLLIYKTGCDVRCGEFNPAIAAVIQLVHNAYNPVVCAISCATADLWALITRFTMYLMLS